MLLRQIYDEDLAQAAWLLGCQQTGEAIVIDPERDIDRYMETAKAHGLRITAVAETHIHADFLSGARQLAQATGAHVFVSGLGGDEWRSQWLGSFPHTELGDGDNFSIGGIEFTTIHTPGHTPEHVSFLVMDRGGGANEPLGIFSGDFVFVGALGRPDLLETAVGVEGAMEDSARELAGSARSFLELPDFLQVFPAHGAGSSCGKALGAIPQSTVGYERRFNPALGLADDEGAFVAEILMGQPAPPLYFARMKIQNRDGVPLLEKMPRPARCAPGKLDDGGRTVIDLRGWEAFRDGHLPGALWSRIGPFFCASIGSYVMPEEKIALICREEDVERLTRCLVRIGLDLVEAYCTIEAFEEFAASKHGSLQATEEIEVNAIGTHLEASHPILDVRRADEYDASHLGGAINAPHTRILDQLENIPRDKGPILVHCLAGIRSATACSALERAGFSVVNLAGGWAALERAGATAGRTAT